MLEPSGIEQAKSFPAFKNNLISHPDLEPESPTDCSEGGTDAPVSMRKGFRKVRDGVSSSLILIGVCTRVHTRVFTEISRISKAAQFARQ